MTQHDNTQNTNTDVPANVRTILLSGEWLEGDTVEPFGSRAELSEALLAGSWKQPRAADTPDTPFWQVETASGDAFACRLLDRDPTVEDPMGPAVRQLHLLRQLALDSIPVIVPLAVVTSDGPQLLVQKAVEAKNAAASLNNGDAIRSEIVAELARVLARIHSLELYHYDMIPELSKGFTFLNAWFEELTDFFVTLPNDTPQKELLLWLLRWLEHEKLPCPEVKLVHGQYHPAHALLTPDLGLRAIIDWTQTQTGDETSDIADMWLSLSLGWGEGLATEFLEAYRGHGPLEPDRLEYYKVFAITRRYQKDLAAGLEKTTSEQAQLVALLQETVFWRD